MGLIWIGIGFASFGLLVGLTCGLSSAQLTTTLLALLFALIGGSIGVFLGKLDDAGRKVTGVALFAFSVFASSGLVSGIYIRINDLLRTTPLLVADAMPEERAHAFTYLQAANQEVTDFLQTQVQRRDMTLPVACEKLSEQGRANSENK